MTGLLSTIRVLDFGRFIAGPYCAALLGHLGAEVIRIERPAGSEDRYLAPITEQGEGGIFIQMNCNKRGLTLDIAHPDGRAIVQKLVATADVVVANLPPETLASLELDYASLTAIKPDIILAANTVYGHSGPYTNKIGFDGIAQAMSGAVWFSGQPDQPAKAAVHYVDFASGLASALGVMAALMARQQTGQGQVVETSLLATALTLANAQLIEQAVIDANRTPTGNRGQTAAPSDIFATKDGFVMIQVAGPYIFKRWAKLMGKATASPSEHYNESEYWLSNAKFKDDIARGNNRDELCKRTQRWCSKRTTDEALAELEDARIPAGPVLNWQEALDHPYVQALDHLKPVEYPGSPRPVPVADTPFNLSNTPMGLRERAPTLGEHTTEVLAELGINADEIARLRNNGVI